MNRSLFIISLLIILVVPTSGIFLCLLHLGESDSLSKQELPDTSSYKNGLTLTGFPVRGDVEGYYIEHKRLGWQKEEFICDALVVTNGDNDFIERFALSDSELYQKNENGSLILNVSLNKMDDYTKRALLESSSEKPLSLTITDFEELGGGVGPCYSTIDLIKIN